MKKAKLQNFSAASLCLPKKRITDSPGVELGIQYIYSTFNKDFSTHHGLNIILDAKDIIVSKTDKNTILEFTLLEIKPRQYHS